MRIGIKELMNQTIEQAQIKQQTIEGLSVAAISYYGIQLMEICHGSRRRF